MLPLAAGGDARTCTRRPRSPTCRWRPRPTWRRRRGASTRAGPRHVLVKGGHLKDSATDILYDGRGFTRFPGPAARLDTTRTAPAARYSSAIAAGLAHGQPLARRHPRGQGLRHRGHPRGLPGRPRRRRPPPLRRPLVSHGPHRRRQDAVHGAPGRAARPHRARARRGSWSAPGIALPFSQKIVDWLARPDHPARLRARVHGAGRGVLGADEGRAHRRPLRRRARASCGRCGRFVAPGLHDAREEVRRRRSSSSARCCSSWAAPSRCSW